MESIIRIVISNQNFFSSRLLSLVLVSCPHPMGYPKPVEGKECCQKLQWNIGETYGRPRPVL